MLWKKVFYLEYLFACYFYKYSVQVSFIKRKSNLKDSINHETNLFLVKNSFPNKIKQFFWPTLSSFNHCFLASAIFIFETTS